MLLGIIRLLRLSNSLSAGVLVLLGAKLTGASLLERRLWLAMAAMWAVTAFGYVSNDLSDLAEDRVNKPDRPLPSGVVTTGQALCLALCLLAAALLLSSQLGFFPLVVAMSVVALLHLYNRKLKAAAGLGNLLIAGLAACALLPGSIAINGWQPTATTKVLPAAGVLALFILAREMIKTLEDITGDQVAGKRTIAIWVGIPGTLWLIAGCAVLLLVMLGFLICWRTYSMNAILLMLFGVTLPLCYVIYYLFALASTTRVRSSLALLKGCYFIGLLAFWLA